jgi:hypothetical protein
MSPRAAQHKDLEEQALAKVANKFFTVNQTQPTLFSIAAIRFHAAKNVLPFVTASLLPFRTSI